MTDIQNPTKPKKKRLYSLDYLRGIAASGIMIYHLITWSFGKFTSETFLGRFGIYGVGIFYILSGLTLCYVYYDKFEPTKKFLIDFFKKRILRIFPLLWLVTIVSIILSRKIPDFLDLALNLTGLFGFVKWDTYFSSGIWSIGNELVFYVFFPVFLLLAKYKLRSFILLTAIIIAIYVYFAFYVLDPSISLLYQWDIYTNPLNQVFLFLSGFLIGYLLREKVLNKYFRIILFFGGLLLFIHIPSSGDTINIITGINRLAFSVCCIAICISLYKSDLKLPTFIHIPLIFLGDISYSVYLIHPIVYSLVSYIASTQTQVESNENFKLILIVTSIVLTIITSYIVYEKYEKLFLKFGRGNKNK